MPQSPRAASHHRMPAAPPGRSGPRRESPEPRQKRLATCRAYAHRIDRRIQRWPWKSTRTNIIGIVEPDMATWDFGSGNMNSRTRPGPSRSPKSAVQRCQPRRPRPCTWRSERLQPRFRSTRTRSRGPQRRTVRRWWSTPGRCAQQVARPRGDVRDRGPDSGPVDVDRLGRRSGVDGEVAAAGGHGARSTLTGRRARHGAVRRVDAGPSGVQFHATVTSVLFHPDVAAAGEVLSAADGGRRTADGKLLDVSPRSFSKPLIGS